MADVLSRKPLHQESKEWQCPHCTAVNNPADIDCRTCIKPKPGRSRLSSNLEEEQNKLPEGGPVKQSFVDNVKWLVLGKPAPWRCPRCTCEMGGYYTNCSACGFLRTDGRRRSDTSMISDIFSIFRRPPEQSRRGSQQATSVDPDLDSGIQDISQGNSGGWECPQCTFRNEEKAKACRMCEHSKPKKDNKRKRRQRKANDILASFEVIDTNDDLLRMTPLSIIEGIDGIAPLEDENNQSLPQYPASDAPSSSSLAEQSSELVLPHSLCSPQHHHLHHSLPSPPLAPQPQLHPHPSSSSGSTASSSSQLTPRLKPQTAVLSNPNTQSWKCSVCGAFNLIFLPNQKCFVCGIGLIPSTLLTPGDIDVANNRTQVHHPGSLVVHNHPAPPRAQAGHGELVYTTQPTAIAPTPMIPMPLDSDQLHHHRHGHAINDLSGGQVEPPQRPTRLTQRSGSGRRRRDSSIRRSAEDPLSTPGGNATVLLRLVKHQYELEADRIYTKICQYCKKVRK